MLKYVNTDVVFAEIPDQTTLAINISGCPCRCPGCHSQYLWADIGTPLDTNALDRLVEEYGNDITCVAFMGGDAAPDEISHLARHLHKAHPLYKVAWYSGRIRLPHEADKMQFDYIKVGPYIRHLGPLNSPTTNQRLFRRCEDNTFEDITKRLLKDKNTR